MRNKTTTLNCLAKIFYQNGLQRRFDEAAKKGMHFDESKENDYIERFDKLHRKLDHLHPRGAAYHRMRSIHLQLKLKN